MNDFNNNKISCMNAKSAPEMQVAQTNMQILSISDEYDISNEPILVFYALNHKFSFIYPYERDFMVGIQFEEEQMILMGRENLNNKDIFIIKSLIKNISELKNNKDTINLAKDLNQILNNTLITKYLYGKIESEEEILKILYNLSR